MPSMGIATLIKAASVLALAQQALGDCYRPDGTDRNISPYIKDGEAPYQPCKKPGGGHSMCCNTKSSDQCRDNGLCYNKGTKLLWRESCSDPTWKDPACLKLCSGANQLNADGKALSGQDSLITVCSGDSQLCCGSGDFAQRCCDANKGFFMVNGTVVEAHPTEKAKGDLASTKDSSGDASSDDTDEKDTGNATPSGSGSSGPKKDGSNGGGEGEGSAGKGSALIGGLVGGILGGVLGGLILFAITTWFVLRKRRATKGLRYVNAVGSASDLPGAEGKRFNEVPATEGKRFCEVPGGGNNIPVAQLSGTEGKRFYEVPGDNNIPVAQLPTRTQTRKGGELPAVETYYEMPGSPVSR